ncbi:MAG: alpha/beta fold hydrolase [Polymorphobacter sp.]|uniref:alpha/beta fold hydrolase n=1 Tax=Polymorphobacter sp. TaxID=1909290 RepID=UPI003A8B0B06
MAARWPGGLVRRVPVSGGALAVEVLGPEGAPALVMLHGWTLDRRMWRPQLELAGRLRLVGVDRRGFGQSDAAADLAAEPDDVLRVADALGLERFFLLGMSQGGKVALHVAADAGARVAGLVLQGTALDGVDAADEAVPLAAMAAAARLGALGAMRTLWAGHALTRLAGEAGRDEVAAMLADYDGRDLLSGPGQLTAGAEMMARIEAPVLAAVGDRDTARRQANVAALAARGAQALVMTGAGHLANLDKPREFNGILAAFCRESR